MGTPARVDTVIARALLIPHKPFPVVQIVPLPAQVVPLPANVRGKTRRWGEQRRIVQLEIALAPLPRLGSTSPRETAELVGLLVWLGGRIVDLKNFGGGEDSC